MNVFNDKAFSDRILHVEIVADSLDSKSDSMESDVECDNNKKQKIEKLEGNGDVAGYDSDIKFSTDVKVKTLHISSAILATRSHFFYKLFKNGMKESQESIVTLRINASEEAALMDLLNFMYSNTLIANSTPELLAVLIIADKFEVSSCMSYCCEQFKKMTMYLSYALLYLELPSSVLESAVVQPLLDAAKKAVVERYKNVVGSSRYRNEAMKLPLSAIELVLGCDGLKVKSEEEVYDFILLWGRARYPNQEERREILTKLVGRFLHFPSLSMSRLEQIRECPDFDKEEVSKLIMNSLYLNAAVYGQRYHFVGANSRHSIQRDYDDLPIKQVQLESGCVVYLNLTKEKCWDLVKSSKGVHSQPFLLGGVPFDLFIVPEPESERVEDEDVDFGVFVERQESDGTSLFNYEIAVMTVSSKEFKCRHKDNNCTLYRRQRVGSRKLFKVPFSEYFEDCDDGEYVIDGVVRVRAEFTIIDSQA